MGKTFLGPVLKGLAVFAWLAGVIPFYFAIDTWNISPGNKGALFVVWLAVPMIVVAYYFGLQKKQQVDNQTPKQEMPNSRTAIKEDEGKKFEDSQSITSASKVETDRRIEDHPKDLEPVEQAWLYMHQGKKEDAYRSIEEAIKLEKEPSKECGYRTLRVMIKMRFDEGNPIEDLPEIVRTYPDQSFPLRILAGVYEDRGSFEKAQELYLKSAQLEKKSSVQIDDYVMAARMMNELTRFEEAERILAELLDKTKSDVEGARIFTELGSIYERAKKTEEMFCSYEKALALNPENNELRFDVAHKYSQNGADDLVLYHYKLADVTDAVLNNLGVAYNRLSMPLRAIKNYKAASSKGSTIASANLAYDLIEKGFLDEAMEILKTASEKNNVHQNVYSALAEVKKLMEDDGEKEKEEKALKEANTKRRYSIGFIEACIDQSSQTTPGVWQISDDFWIAIISIQERKFEGFIYQSYPALTSLSAIGSGLTGSRNAVSLYRLSGELKGRSVKIKWQYHDTKKELSSAWKVATESGDGYFFFLENGNKLSGYLKDFVSKGNIKFIDAIKGSDDEHLSILKKIKTKMEPPQAFSS